MKQNHILPISLIVLVVALAGGLLWYQTQPLVESLPTPTPSVEATATVVPSATVAPSKSPLVSPTPATDNLTLGQRLQAQIKEQGRDPESRVYFADPGYSKMPKELVPVVETILQDRLYDLSERDVFAIMAVSNISDFEFRFSVGIIAKDKVYFSESHKTFDLFVRKDNQGNWTDSSVE